jgi:hypothetical protein
MTRKTWAGIAVLIVAVLQLAGFFGGGDYYDTRHPMYAFVAQFVPKDQQARAEAYTAAMQRQDVATLNAMTDPSVLNADFYASVPKIAQYFPAGNPVSEGALQYSVTSSSDGRSAATLVTNHVYANGGVVFTTVYFNKVNGKIQGFQLRSLAPADLKALRFRPLEANITQGAVLGVVLAVIAFGLITLYRCLATPGVRFKWLWFIFITAGIFSLRFNWLTQLVGFAPIQIQWGPAGIYQGLFEPATLYINAPVGAMAWWLFGARRAAAAKVR